MSAIARADEAVTGPATIRVPDPLTNPTVDVAWAAALVGVGRNTAYESIGRGDWPTQVLRVGRTIRIPTRPLLDALGLGES